MPVSNRADLLLAMLDVAREDRRELRDRLAAALWELRKLRRACKSAVSERAVVCAKLERERDERRRELWHDEGTP